MNAIVCTVVLKKSNKFLFVLETKDEAKGKYGLPGGQLELGESLEQCALRELQEETGYTGTDLKLIAINHKPHTQYDNSVVKFVYTTSRFSKGNQRAELKTEWLTLDEVKKLSATGMIRGADIVDILESKHPLSLTIQEY